MANDKDEELKWVNPAELIKYCIDQYMANNYSLETIKFIGKSLLAFESCYND